VFPVAAGVEKAGTFTNLERRIQRSRPTREPPETARSDFDVLRELGRRLCGPATFDYSEVGAVFDELVRVAPTHRGLASDETGPEGWQWPVGTDGVLYGESFDTPDGLAAFGTAQHAVEPTDATVDSNAAGGLQLVAGGRASEFEADHSPSDRQLRPHPADARDRGIESTDEIVVSNGRVRVETAVEITDRIRQGTVYLPAAAADPFLRCERSTVTIRPASEPTDGPT
jgi:formate dehydrogenase major subunit